jgi:gas vesicle protein
LLSAIPAVHTSQLITFTTTLLFSMASNNRKNHNESSGLAPFVIGVLTGGLVGAAFALLYAPKPGADMRRDLRFRLDDMTDSINDLIGKATGSMPEYMNESRDRAARVVDDARTKASDLIQNADRTIAEARRRAQGGEAAMPNSEGAGQPNNTDTDLPPDAINDAL